MILIEDPPTSRHYSVLLARHPVITKLCLVPESLSTARRAGGGGSVSMCQTIQREKVGGGGGVKE